MKKILLLIFIASGLVSFSQGLTAFQDFRNNFIVFDEGEFKTLENQPVLKYGIGGKCIPYIDNLGYFKIYADHKVYEITYGANIDFLATDNLVTYFFNDQLWVFENGKKTLLTVWTKNFKVSDYTVAYLDNNSNSFNIYQDGKIIKIEDVMTGVNELNYKVGENLIAYSYFNSFMVYYGGKKQELTFNNEPGSYQTGRNIVAYTNLQEQSFNVFYSGTNFKIEDFLPSWYSVGDNMVIYKDQLNNLKIFDKGEVKFLSNFEVSQIAIADNICTYVEQNQFKVYFNNEIKTLEFFSPKSRILDQNTVIYTDQNNSLKYFDGVSGKIITSEIISQFDLNINIISYKNSGNRTKVFYKGEIYQQ